MKKPYSEECLFCNSEFIRTDKIKFFPCKKHIFHSRCFEKNDDKNINSLRCPKCENVNNNSNLSNNNLGPNHNLHSDNNSEDNNNDNSEESNNENDNDNHDNDEESNDEDNNEENEEFEDDLDSFVDRGLDKEMLDNMPIFKIKDAEKLNDDKKMCWICFGNFVNGDDSIALPCIHIFHANCIKVWLKDHKICPNCKKTIRKNNLICPRCGKFIGKKTSSNSKDDEIDCKICPNCNHKQYKTNKTCSNCYYSFEDNP